MFRPNWTSLVESTFARFQRPSVPANGVRHVGRWGRFGPPCTTPSMTAFLYALVILEALLYSLAAGLLIEPRYQVDLIEGLHIYNVTYIGLSVVEGVHRLSPAIQLAGELRQLQLPPEVYSRAIHLLSHTNEFTFMAMIRQEEKNTGTIVAFSEGNNRFLELQSSGRKDEVRLHYSHKNNVYVETFPYHLADDSWHQVAVAVSGNTVELFVDCNRIYRRVIHDVDHNLTGRNMTLWLGQRSLRHFFFKGLLQDVKIVARPHGYIMQCPHLDTACPTCGQFRQLQVVVLHLESHIRELTDRLAQAEQRIAAVEGCECQKSCHFNGSVHPDGATWKQGCDICSCVRGEIKCHPVMCPPAPCKNPIQALGECCPMCLKQCLLKGVLYDHGEQISPKQCVQCECRDGSMQCRRIDPDSMCPPLSCPEHEQFSVPGECCRFCPGVDYCSRGHDCHANASCLNLPTRYACQCITGYQGDGKHCEDINECLREGDHDGHHCRLYTKCVNIPGSYVCECLSGYKRVDAFNCMEHDECTTNEHECHQNAICINTAGSYKCQCLEGYQGGGYVCEPICNRTCLNGGQCVAPGVCSCHRGFTGAVCEIDVDECSMGLHQCHATSRCVNMLGWYYCDCLDGYHSHLIDNNLGILCQDIDECAIGTNTCHGTALCVNDDGGYHCECKDNVTCSLNCLYSGIEKYDGDTWVPATDTCSHCMCRSGVVECVRDPCNCGHSEVNVKCCPQCDRTSYCHHQEASVTFSNGQRWTYQCQTCECMYGEVDCWDIECPPVLCNRPVYDPDNCCPRCEDDPCSSLSFSDPEGSNISAIHPYPARGCMYLGRMYRSGEQVSMIRDPCTSCKCKNGRLCCLYTSSCPGDAINTTAVVPTRSVRNSSGFTGFSHDTYTVGTKKLLQVETTSITSVAVFPSPHQPITSPKEKPSKHAAAQQGVRKAGDARSQKFLESYSQDPSVRSEKRDSRPIWPKAFRHIPVQMEDPSSTLPLPGTSQVPRTGRDSRRSDLRG